MTETSIPTVITPAADGPGAGPTADPTPGQLAAVYDVPVQLAVVLGRATVKVGQLVRLGRGAVVELDRRVGEPVDILVNNRVVARGRVTVVDDRLGVTLTEIVKSA